MDKLYGYAGKILRVDLTSGKITEEKIDKETARKYIGGTCLGAKYLYEEVSPGIDWSDEANRLIIASGPLAGTRFPGSGTFSVVTKGALTNGAATSQANGFFGAFLRFSGFDGIILQGAIKRLSYLYIHDGLAELKEATHLAGKDTWETEDIVKKELGKKDHEMSVYSIGPAGENLVRFAAITGDRGHVAGHNGVGAVMGSKKLKAIAVARGGSKIPMMDEEAFSGMAREVRQILETDPASRGYYLWGTLTGVTMLEKSGGLPIKNYLTNIYNISPEDLEKFGPEYIRGKFEPKPHPCWACNMHHCHMLKIPDGPYAGLIVEEPEYEQFAACGPVIGVTDVASAIMLSHEVDILGLENNEAGWIIGFVMECYEKGILTKDDCGGLEMTWGNAEAARELLRRIATRQGLGDLLAEGVKRASERLGKEAPNIGIYTMKGNSPRGHDHRSAWLEMFDTSVSNTGTIETSRLVQRQFLGLPKITDPTTISPEDTVTDVALCKGSMQFEDSLGICRFTGRTDIPIYNRAIKAATGLELTLEDDMEIGRRAVHLLRAFNIRCGITAEMDAPSPRYGSTPVDGAFKGRNILPYWNDMRSKYYEMMGWDKKTGKPLPETLKKFGLEHVIPDLWEK